MYNLPFCPTHNYQILNLLELRKDDARLICGSCLLNLVKTQQHFDASNIVDLVQIYDHPENIMQFTNAKDMTVVTQFLNNQKEKMNLIKSKIEQLINELEQWQQELLQQQKAAFLNIIKQDEFKQNFQYLTNQDKSVKIEIIQQIQNKFYNYFQSIKVMNQLPTQEDLQNLDKISQKIYKSGKFEDIFKSINKVELDYNLFFNTFLDQVVSTIQKNVNRKMKNKVKIYQSLENGLTFQAIRNVIIGKENLLWFFKSSNNTQFGAFTPYIWIEGGYSGATENNPSFLFSKTLNQIYPIIQKMGTCTQWFSFDYILFGGNRNYDQDLRINPDFKSGYSRLGVGYKAPEGVDTSKYSSHLFGALEPNVVECEIYQIIYE